MSGRRLAGAVQGQRPGGSDRNGLQESAGTGYRFKGQPDWYPAGGVHRDPGIVVSRDPSLEVERRISEYARLALQGLTQRRIAAEMGMSVSRIQEYSREVRLRAKESGRGLRAQLEHAARSAS